MIGIIDYGMGNLRSVQKALEYVGFEAIISNKPKEFDNCSHIVLPGVGAFGDAMNELSNSGLLSTIYNSVNIGKPFLGICLGMQMLFDKSYEDGEYKGLGILRGEVQKFDIDLKVPHIGWNTVESVKESSLFENIIDRNFYFVHSYYINHNNENKCGITNYSIGFTSAVEKDNVYGVQFHPEKSGDTGLKMLKNFGGLK